MSARHLEKWIHVASGQFAFCLLSNGPPTSSFSYTSPSDTIPPNTCEKASSILMVPHLNDFTTAATTWRCAVVSVGEMEKCNLVLDVALAFYPLKKTGIKPDIVRGFKNRTRRGGGLLNIKGSHKRTLRCWNWNMRHSRLRDSWALIQNPDFTTHLQKIYSNYYTDIIS